MALLRVLLVALPLAGMLALAAAPVGAQGGEELLEEAACREDPHSEVCICSEVHAYSLVPRFVDNTGWPPTAFALDCSVDGSGNRSCVLPSGDTARNNPRFDVNTLRWVPDESSDEKRALSIDRDFVLVQNEKYKAYCSMSYLRENIRRLWLFALALAGGLVAITVAWGGTIYMQEAVSGETRSFSRTVMIRSLLGLVLLAAVFLIWEGVSGMFLGGFDIWRSSPGFLEVFQEGRRP